VVQLQLQLLLLLLGRMRQAVGRVERGNVGGKNQLRGCHAGKCLSICMYGPEPAMSQPVTP
jgi:hypothetical protein